MNFLFAPKPNKGFTLIEILVVISIVGILMAVVGVNAVQSGQTSRDAKRQADLRMLQSAIELYKNKNGEYPVGCRGAGNWSGQQGTSYACSGGDTQYIVGLAPEFIPVLPADKKLAGPNSGYVYMTNGNGTVFKLKAQNTVESEDVTYLHPFKPCDIRVFSQPNGDLGSGSNDREIIGWCGLVDYSGGVLPGSCRSTNSEFARSYAVWGGFEPKLPPVANNSNPAVVRNTTDIICR